MAVVPSPLALTRHNSGMRPVQTPGLNNEDNAMPRMITMAAAVLATLATIGAARAQSDTPLHALPAPPVAADASAATLLLAAQSALVTGRSGEAQEALEMAQTRLLDRSVPLFQTNTPSQDPGVAAIGQALKALASGDREATLRHIQAALAMTQQGAAR